MFVSLFQETRGTLGLGSICSLDRNQLFAPVGNYRVSIGNLDRLIGWLIDFFFVLYKHITDSDWI